MAPESTGASAPLFWDQITGAQQELSPGIRRSWNSGTAKSRVLRIQHYPIIPHVSFSVLLPSCIFYISIRGYNVL